MNRMKWLLVIVLLAGCEVSPENQLGEAVEFELEALETPVEASLRGLQALDENTIWASGSEGTWVRTTDGGKNWQHGIIVDSIQFRDIQAFGEDTALVISAGHPALIYKTVDGGENWELKYSNFDDRIFFDAMDFWNGKEGIAFSDAFDGRFYMVTTSDQGETWQEMPLDQRPAANENEGGFAASGTNMVISASGRIWIGTTEGRIIYSDDRGVTWITRESPLMNEAPVGGVFSLAFNNDGQKGVMVGGNFMAPRSDSLNAATWTEEEGWKLVTDNKPAGYRSGSCYVPESNIVFSTGTNGVDISMNNGNDWVPLDSIGYHAVHFGKDINSGWLSGPDGRIAKIKLKGK